MGTITVQKNADKAWLILQDTQGAGGVRWQASEMLGWHNDGQREIVMVLPSAYTKAAKVAPVASETRQTLAGMSITDGLQVIRPTRNFNAAGSTPGRAITKIAHAVLDQEKPAWHSETAAEAIHYTSDPADPKAFYLWPAITGGGKVELVYSAAPPDATAITDTIALDDIYSNALQYYMLFRALTKRTANSAPARQEAAAYYNLMLQVLGVKDRITMGTDQAQTAMGQQA
jgi:hypothetical protein